MNVQEKIERAFDPARPRKSSAHLFLLPVAFSAAGACAYFLVLAAVGVASAFREDVRGFSSYGEASKSLMAVAMLLGSFPIGFLAANLVAWSIAPLRRYFVPEANGRSEEGFRSSMRGLLMFARYWTSILVLVGFGAALCGR